MSEYKENFNSSAEKRILRKVKGLLTIAIITALCGGIGIGILVNDRRASAIDPEAGKTAEAVSTGFSEVAKAVEPAVVNIDTKGKIPEANPLEPKPQTSSPDEMLEYFKRQMRRPSYAVGSGFIIDKTGVILTNSHVVDDASRITVRLQTGEEYTAKVLGADEESDLAVLKIEAGKDLPSVKLGDSDRAEVGDWVLAIGSPFGLAQTVTAGIISQTKRETPQSSFQKFIQTDAAINRGNSGGPLVNMKGEVIGVNSQIATSTGDYNGIGFALPSNQAAAVYRQLISYGKVRRGYLGIGPESVKPEFAKVYGLAEAKGAIITSVNDTDGPAAKAGIRVNDIIVEIDGQTVENAQDMITKIAAKEPGSEVSIVYLREVNDKLERFTTKAVLGERPANISGTEEGARSRSESNSATGTPLGLTLQELSSQPTAVTKYENQKGVLIKDIDPAANISDLKNSQGRDAVRVGDLIQRINRKPVTDVKSFNDIAAKLKSGDAVVLHILSQNPRTKVLRQSIVQFTVQ